MMLNTCDTVTRLIVLNTKHPIRVSSSAEINSVFRQSDVRQRVRAVQSVQAVSKLHFTDIVFLTDGIGKSGHGRRNSVTNIIRIAGEVDGSSASGSVVVADKNAFCTLKTAIKSDTCASVANNIILEVHMTILIFVFSSDGKDKVNIT